MKKSIIIIILFTFSILVAEAQIPQPDQDTTAKHFLIVASIGNLQEVSAGQLAVKKGKRTDVRSFGQMMVDDHGKAEQQLLELARKEGYQLPSAATGGIKPDLNLKSVTDSFDQLYVHAMTVNHNNTLQTFENYATTGKDPHVKAFALQMLPILKQHLNEIKTIDREINLVGK